MKANLTFFMMETRSRSRKVYAPKQNRSDRQGPVGIGDQANRYFTSSSGRIVTSSIVDLENQNVEVDSDTTQKRVVLIVKGKKNDERTVEKSETNASRSSFTFTPLSAAPSSSPTMETRYPPPDELPIMVEDSMTNRKTLQRFNHFLRLPKPFRWVGYEWFYSSIDRAILQEKNDFEACLKEIFPILKTRKLRRVEWVKVRRMIGKPRRLSPAFLNDERKELAVRREKIRQLQQRQIPSEYDLKELPDKVPMHLMIGANVTALLHESPDGLFKGKVSGTDLSNNTYRILFEKTTLGRKSVPDFEVMPDDPPETLSVSSIDMKRDRMKLSKFGADHERTVVSTSLADPCCSKDSPGPPFPKDEIIGGYPVQLLKLIVQVTKLLKAKYDQIKMLKELHSEAEKTCAPNRRYPKNLILRYSSCVLFLNKLNSELSLHFGAVHRDLSTIADEEESHLSWISPKQVLENSDMEAEMMVSSFCRELSTTPNKRIKNLISLLGSLMLQLKVLSKDERNQFEIRSIRETTEKIKASLIGTNVKYFQNCIEIPMNRISAGFCCMEYPGKVETGQLKRKTRC